MRTAAQIEHEYYRTMDAQRKEARQRKQVRAVGVDRPINGINPHVLYVWRRDCWVLVAFTRMAPTVKRATKWRMKYNVKPWECVRFKSLWEAQRNGPPLGAPTETVPRARKKDELRIVQRAIKRARLHTEGMPRCEYTRHGVQCAHRAPWWVAYMSRVSNTRRTVNRCTKHAWNDLAFPRGCTQLIRVQRSTARRSSTLS